MGSKIAKNYLPEIMALGLTRTKPAMVTVNLTNQCNQHCLYCEIGKTHPKAKSELLTKDDLKWIIDQMAIHHIPQISLCGGEPFLFDGLIQIVEYAGMKKIHCSITTNGMTAYQLLDSELQLLKTYKTEINISLDSFDDDLEFMIRGSAHALPNALKSIQKLTESHIPVTVLTAISKYNYQKLFDFFSTAHDKGIKQVLFQPIIYYSNFPDLPPVLQKSQLNVPVDKLDVLMLELKKILQFEKRHQIITNVYRIMPWIEAYLRTAAEPAGKWFFDDVLNKFYCREIDAIIDISYDGGIQPCGLSKAEIDIRKNRQLGLMELWRQATAGIKEDLKKDNFYDYCNGCCHHFSRNMLASIAKYPVRNRAALLKIAPSLLSRIWWRTMKTIDVK